MKNDSVLSNVLKVLCVALVVGALTFVPSTAASNNNNQGHSNNHHDNHHDNHENDGCREGEVSTQGHDKDCEPSPTPSPSPEPTPSPTPVPPQGNGFGLPGDGLSDGRSDGRSSCPECTKPHGEVLGATTDFAGTGAASDMLMNAVGMVGGLSTAAGVAMIGKKRSDK